MRTEVNIIDQDWGHDTIVHFNSIAECAKYLKVSKSAVARALKTKSLCCYSKLVFSNEYANKLKELFPHIGYMIAYPQNDPKNKKFYEKLWAELGIVPNE